MTLRPADGLWASEWLETFPQDTPHPPVFVHLLIPKGFKFFAPHLFILQGLRARFCASVHFKGHTQYRSVEKRHGERKQRERAASHGAYYYRGTALSRNY